MTNDRLPEGAAYTQGLRDLADMDHVSPPVADVLRDCASMLDNHRDIIISALNEVERLREALAKTDKFITDFRSPWGAWKTAWWEGEVSDDAAFTPDNALMHCANIVRQALKELS